MSSLSDEAKSKMNQVIEHLKHELKSIRTGRANPTMIEAIVVEVYGTKMRLKDLGNISTPEPRQLLITPYDLHNAGSIRQSIEKANLGLQPVLDGNVVRITIPPMDEQQRLEMVKLCHKKREEAKVGIRNVRRDCNDAARKQKSDGDLSEDQLKTEEKHIQELTDKFCKQCDEVSAVKEKEVMVV